ncbi:MAG: hypothetical protein FWF29_03345, partial [Treponema sp.]|nr:hypothetical protein [Treponema sp.]
QGSKGGTRLVNAGSTSHIGNGGKAVDPLETTTAALTPPPPAGASNSGPANNQSSPVTELTLTVDYGNYLPTDGGTLP